MIGTEYWPWTIACSQIADGGVHQEKQCGWENTEWFDDCFNATGWTLNSPTKHTGTCAPLGWTQKTAHPCEKLCGFFVRLLFLRSGCTRFFTLSNIILRKVRSGKTTILLHWPCIFGIVSSSNQNVHNRSFALTQLDQIMWTSRQNVRDALRR